ncbi:MAG: zinc ribbon domain-containing protein [Polyangiales bacterium]
MPTYEYACTKCGHQWDEIQKMSDPTLDECPQCHQKTAQRLISQGNFILKGGGWYTTGGYGSPAKSTESATSASPSTSSAAATTPATPATTTSPSTAPAATPAPAKSDSSTKPSGT